MSSSLIFVRQFQYDKVRKCHYINAQKLLDLMCIKNVPYPDATDTMIDSYLISKLFVNTMDGKHKGNMDCCEYHAQRIASLIDLNQKGTPLRPVIIFYDEETKKIEIEDGWHRIRAAYYLNENVACQLEVE
jgi:hypothetical protein